MKKYAVITETTGDCFDEVFNTEEEAIDRADYEWHIKTYYDKKRTTRFYVASCEVYDDDDDYINWDLGLDIVKTYK